MRRIGILTAGGDTPALNATIYGAVTRANELHIEIYGIIKGFSGMLNPRMPHLHLNPLFTTIPELSPCLGGSILGASRTYINPEESGAIREVAGRLEKLGIEGLICIGGDGTINGMQPLSHHFPSVLAPKTIDNDLGLNHADEANEWLREPGSQPGKFNYRKLPGRDEIELDEIVNYATPGYATAVYVAATGIERIRTTAESHRRIAIIEVMGRDSGYLALGSAYGQPDIILVPESPLNFARLEERVHELYQLQKHVVIVVGEGMLDEQGRQLGAVSTSTDPAGNRVFSGAAEHLKQLLVDSMGNDYFTSKRRNESADSAIFTRKLGHTQRGGRPILFDRFHAAQLGGQAIESLVEGENNSVVTLQWTEQRGFYVDSIHANKLRDQWGMIHPRQMHRSLYDPHRFQPSKLGIRYLLPIFTNAIGADDMEDVRVELFHSGNLTQRYQSVNIDIQKRLRTLED
ncbi:MAG: 6-phosphofructokinase [Planctomycetaceae bacterium]